MKNNLMSVRSTNGIVTLRPVSIKQTNEIGRENDKQLNDYIVVPTAGTFHFVHFKDIIRLEADGNCTHIYLLSGKHILVTKPIKLVYLPLPTQHFIRPHQSHVVNIACIQYIQRMEEIVLSDGERVSISRSRKKELKNWLAKYRLF